MGRKSNSAKLKALIEDPYQKATAINYEGFPAWQTPDEVLLKQVLYTNTIGNSFYLSQLNSLKMALDLFQRYPDPKKMAELIVKARNEGYMRTITILALVILSRKNLQLFEEIFPKVIKTGNDLASFIDLARALNRGGTAIRRTILNWIKANLNPFYALKYGNEIVDGINLCRPAEAEFTKEQATLIDYLKKKKDRSTLTLPLEIKTFEELKKTDDENQIIELIKQGRLDYSVVEGVRKPTPKIWKALAEEMGLFALLRHLATFERNNVLVELYPFLKGRFTVKAFQNAMIFPFRIFLAYKQIRDQKVKDLLAEVLDKYVPLFDWSVFGKVCIAPDVSGSMTLRYKRKWMYATIAGMFAGILHKGIDDSIMLPFDTEIKHEAVLPRWDSVISQIAKIEEASGGGTYMELPVAYLIKQKISIDNYICITDNIEWGDGWFKHWCKYKKKVNPEAKAFLIRIDSYDLQCFPPEDANKYDIYQIFGWSNNVIDFIIFHLTGGQIPTAITEDTIAETAGR